MLKSNYIGLYMIYAQDLMVVVCVR